MKQGQSDVCGQSEYDGCQVCVFIVLCWDFCGQEWLKESLYWFQIGECYEIVQQCGIGIGVVCLFLVQVKEEYGECICEVDCVCDGYVVLEILL